MIAYLHIYNSCILLYERILSGGRTVVTCLHYIFLLVIVALYIYVVLV
jgi:hypothetical protein